MQAPPHPNMISAPQPRYVVMQQSPSNAQFRYANSSQPTSFLVQHASAMPPIPQTQIMMTAAGSPPFRFVQMMPQQQVMMPQQQVQFIQMPPIQRFA